MTKKYFFGLSCFIFGALKISGMNRNRSILLSFVLLIIIASLYRVWEGRPFGFAPQIAMAIFGGSMISDKRWAFVLPLLSMFLSDMLYQALYLNGYTPISGFYPGQLINYILFAGLTVFGFLLKKATVLRVAAFSISGSLLFFLASNFFVWFGGGGFARPKTFEGLVQVYTDALAFYREYGLIEGFAGNLFLGDLFFSALLFGGYYLFQRVGRKELVVMKN